MNSVHVNASRSYDVYINRGWLRDIPRYMRALLPRADKVFLAEDDRVADDCGSALASALTEQGFDVVRHRMTGGEPCKTMAHVCSLLSMLADSRFSRNDALLALGGGSISDTVGFAASCYLRGVPYVTVPTTLLAMTDASVGGKTGVNLPQGKNLAGAFYQPSAVYIDVDTLSTLPEREIACGMAEVLKYGVLCDRELFDRVKNGMAKQSEEDVIARCVQIKSAYVCADERDTGARQFLNLGHTIGHAIEAKSGYALPHGQCVAIGLCAVSRMSGMPEAALVESACESNGLPTRSPYGADELMPYVWNDKKRGGNELMLVLPQQIGKCALVRYPVSALSSMLERCL